MRASIKLLSEVYRPMMGSKKSYYRGPFSKVYMTKSYMVEYRVTSCMGSDVRYVSQLGKGGVIPRTGAWQIP